MARIRDECEKLIELFAEIAIPRTLEGGSKTGLEPWIIRTYPSHYSNKEVLNLVPYFAHPCSFKCDKIIHFSFVLTNVKSKWTFGYCRHTPESDTCLVILSDLPWHSTFYKILDHCAELLSRKSSIPLERFLKALYTSEIPQPGLQLIVTYTMEDIKLKEFVANCPDHQKLPCIPEDRNITEYYNAISASNMIAIFASMLNERRIVMVSERLNRLSACVQAANTLIYPMHWQHIFIPLLPHTLIEYLSAPMPFLIGVPQETFNDRVKISELGEFVLLNVDTNQLQTPFDDVSTIPSDVLHHLRKAFKNPAALLGDGLCRAFLRALVMLIGGYREALCFSPGEKISFDREAFVQNVRGTSRQLFLENMLQLQIFQQFIESRLDMLNRGERFIDQFEIELNHNEQSSNSRFKSQYREWAATMRKEGGALLRAVNPKVKSALSRGRQAFRQVRQKITAPNHHHSTGDVNSIDRPNSEPSSPKLPPIIKKSISGNFIPTPTSRTVTYVRNPQQSYLNQSIIGGVRSSSVNPTSNSRRTSSGFANGNFTTTITQSSINLNLPKNGVAPSASSESSDIDDNDFTQSHSFNRNQMMSFQDEIESILCLKDDHKSTTNPLISKMENGEIRLPVPPSRISAPSIGHRSRVNGRFGSNNDSSSHDGFADSIPPLPKKSQCLIEFDSPPRTLPSTIQMSDFQSDSSIKNASKMFDPLLEDLTPTEDSPQSPEIRTLHVSNSNFYITGKPPSGNNQSSHNKTSNIHHNNNFINKLPKPPLPLPSFSTTTNGIRKTNPNTTSSNPFGWQMFD